MNAIIKKNDMNRCHEQCCQVFHVNEGPKPFVRQYFNIFFSSYVMEELSAIKYGKINCKKLVMSRAFGALI